MRKRRNEIRLIQFAIILTLIIFAGYITLYLYSASGDNKKIKLTSDACKEFGGVCRERCLANEVARTDCEGEMMCCVEVYPESHLDKSYMEDAVKNKDISKCNSVVNEAVKAACKLNVMDAIYMEFALQYNDRSYCELIDKEEMRAKCFTNLAKKMSNKEFCDEIRQINMRNNCITALALAKKDGMICLNNIDSEIPRNLCLKEVALDVKQASLCNQITMSAEANDCKLKVDLMKKTEGYVNCVSLAESECKENDWCEPIYFKMDCEGCEKFFEICLPENGRLCEDSGGSWNILDEDCNCYDKAWFEGFGCFACNKFAEEFSKKECERRIKA